MVKISRTLPTDYDVGLGLHRHGVFAYVSSNVLPAYFVPHDACAVGIAQRPRQGKESAGRRGRPVYRESPAAGERGKARKRT